MSALSPKNLSSYHNKSRILTLYCTNPIGILEQLFDHKSRIHNMVSYLDYSLDFKSRTLKL